MEYTWQPWAWLQVRAAIWSGQSGLVDGCDVEQLSRRLGVWNHLHHRFGSTWTNTSGSTHPPKTEAWAWSFKWLWSLNHWTSLGSSRESLVSEIQNTFEQLGIRRQPLASGPESIQPLERFSTDKKGGRGYHRRVRFIARKFLIPQSWSRICRKGQNRPNTHRRVTEMVAYLVK